MTQTPTDKVRAAIEYALREDYSVNGIECCRLLEEALRELNGMVTWPKDAAFNLGDTVRKKGTKGKWHGRIVGFYSASCTPIGYAVESVREEGSVQIYPESALEIDDSPEMVLVPVEPTEEQIKECVNTEFGIDAKHLSYRELYAAMIAPYVKGE